MEPPAVGLEWSKANSTAVGFLFYVGALTCLFSGASRAFPTETSYEYVREALRPQLDDLPVVSDFVAKQEGPIALLKSVEQVVRMRPSKLTEATSQASIEDIRRRLAPVPLDVTTQLKMDYEEVRREVTFTHRARLALAIIGALVIIGGGVSALMGQTVVGTLSVTSGIVAELLVALFTSMAREANKRMDQYHKELFRLLEMKQERKSVE